MSTTPTSYDITPETRKILLVAVKFPALRRLLHIEHEGDTVKFLMRPFWLANHPFQRGKVFFDPDKAAELLGKISTGEANCLLFILNVWNPGYAEEKGWRFNFFDAVAGIDRGNRDAIIAWMQNPVWP